MSAVARRQVLHLSALGLELEPGFGAVTGAGPEDRLALGLSARLKHVELFPFVSRHGVRSSCRRGAERPTSTGLVRSYCEATDPRTGQNRKFVPVSK